MASKPKLIVICGPTGVGKTDVAVECAARIQGEIINADSMQVYRQMNIGTAKPSAAQRRRVRHHMIDILEPDEPFDAGGYEKLAAGVILHLNRAGIHGFVVGGTGLYIKSLIHGLFGQRTSDAAVRKELKEIAEKQGTQYLYEQLCMVDARAAKQIHPHDTYRIIRALEVYRLTGKGISEFHHQHRFSNRRYKVLKIGLHEERSVLYEQINRRVDRMIRAGLVEEVQGLLNKGYSEDLKSMKSIGYRHMVAYLKGRLSFQEAVRILKHDTRRYAKRQLTWFRADKDILWFRANQLDDMARHIDHFLKHP